MKTVLIISVAALLGMALIFTVTFIVATRQAERKEAARIRIEQKAAADQQAEAERTEKMDEVSKRMASDLAEINERAKKLEEEREQEKELERKAKAAERLARAQEDLEELERNLIRSGFDLIVARLEREKQLKLSLIGCPYPEKVKAIEDELEKYIAETKNVKEKHAKLLAEYDARCKLRQSLVGCTDPEKRKAIEAELDEPLSK